MSTQDQARPPKMADVGRLAGVSAQTVSRYFTGTGYVGADTRARIEAAIAELDYQLNQSARSLRVNSTRTIGVLTTGPSLYGSWSVLSGLNQAAAAAGYSLLTVQLEADPSGSDSPEWMHRALDRFLSARVDGIIVSSSHFGIEDLLERVWERVPVVLLSGRSWPNADSATVDSYEAGLLAVRDPRGRTRASSASARTGTPWPPRTCRCCPRRGATGRRSRAGRSARPWTRRRSPPCSRATTRWRSGS
jgi:DNA-binding LacI/PurR family transcriptional regulator